MNRLQSLLSLHLVLYQIVTPKICQCVSADFNIRCVGLLAFIFSGSSGIAAVFVGSRASGDIFVAVVVNEKFRPLSVLLASLLQLKGSTIQPTKSCKNFTKTLLRHEKTKTTNDLIQLTSILCVSYSSVQ